MSDGELSEMVERVRGTTSEQTDGRMVGWPVGRTNDRTYVIHDDSYNNDDDVGRSVARQQQEEAHATVANYGQCEVES
ncbi:unnamed protein product [Soboliphyme baturini]|uniref:Uncharacterized protein n=1 Tax=Soboliphyme baturini TaxID=241478 RepID=A0A183IEL5_9BILA|nr:unnamed protein product [Soboliphyme baturini]